MDTKVLILFTSIITVASPNLLDGVVSKAAGALNDVTSLAVIDHSNPLASLAGDQPLKKIVQQLSLLALELVQNLNGADGQGTDLGFINNIFAKLWIPALLFGLFKFVTSILL